MKRNVYVFSIGEGEIAVSCLKPLSGELDNYLIVIEENPFGEVSMDLLNKDAFEKRYQNQSFDAVMEYVNS